MELTEEDCSAINKLLETHDVCTSNISDTYLAGKLAGALNERKRIVYFMRTCYVASTHGASTLMGQTINAVESNNMTQEDVNRIARGYKQI